METIYSLNNYMFTNDYIIKNKIKKYNILNDNDTNKSRYNIDAYKNKIKYNNICNNNVNVYDSDNENDNVINSKNNKDDDYFEPTEDDKLFWCFYITLNGYNSYELIKTSSFKEEKDFKIKSIEKINNFKEEFKKNKLKINEIKNELSNEKKISIKGLYALCIIYKINIMYVNINKGIYFNCFGNINEYDKNEDNDINFFNLPHIIIENISKIFILNNNSNENIHMYKNKYYFLENISKPIKSISNYTITEIYDLCNKLNIQIKTKDNKKINKLELYNSIVNKLE